MMKWVTFQYFSPFPLHIVNVDVSLDWIGGQIVLERKIKFISD